MPVVLILMGMGLVSSAVAQAQGSASAAQAPAAQAQKKAAHGPAQITLGGSFYQAMNSPSAGMGTLQTPANSPGFLFELRYIASPLMGFEFSYGYNPADQLLTPNPGDCRYTCAYAPLELHAKASTIGLNWIFSKKFGALRPFAIAGLGFFVDSTNQSVYVVNTVPRVAVITGGGVDWSVLPKVGIRAQYRDNIYSAPNLSALYPATGKMTYTATPAVGVYYVFGHR
jgi:opacity protein-like surface antigen